MAFSIRTREEKKAKMEFGMVDSVLMQELQDHFCEAHDLYLSCLNKKHGVITKAYGSREELSYIHDKVDMDMHISLLKRLINSKLEDVIEVKCKQSFIKMCGVIVRVNDEIAAIWLVIGLMENAEGLPSYMKCTTEERFYKSVRFLETISRELFAVKQEAHLAQEAFVVSHASELKMEEEVRRGRVLNSVMRFLDSEKEFSGTMAEILKQVGSYMHISNCMLIRETSDEDVVDMICEYVDSKEESVLEGLQQLKKSDLPFFNGKPYMISANSMMPEEFRIFFKRAQLRAGVFLPLVKNGKAEMYLCFMEKKQDRIWEIDDIKFLNDVKRIVQSISNRK